MSGQPRPYDQPAARHLRPAITALPRPCAAADARAEGRAAGPGGGRAGPGAGQGGAVALRRPARRGRPPVWGRGARGHDWRVAAPAWPDAAAAAAIPSEEGPCGAGGISKNFPHLLKTALLGCTAGRPIEIWFQDEARVGQKGSLTDVWAPVGSRPAMVRDNRHSSAYLFGAICPARGVGAAVTTPVVNVAAMNAHLAEISTQVAPGAHAVLLLDRAGWHQRGKRLCVPANITLLDLPADSPELNPMENVWGFLRGNKLSALVWDTYEAIVDACVSAWHFLIGDPERIRSIGTRDWACVIPTWEETDLPQLGQGSEKSGFHPVGMGQCHPGLVSVFNRVGITAFSLPPQV